MKRMGKPPSDGIWLKCFKLSALAGHTRLLLLTDTHFYTRSCILYSTATSHHKAHS